jgi:broad specificity phosphatase PhoE
MILARHGATSANLSRPYVLQGQGVDLPLDPLGIEQAEALSRTLSNEPISRVYCSPLLRALDTAQRAGRPHELTPVIIPSITEANAGEWEGKSWDEVGRDWPKARDLHDEDPATHGYPGGETFLDVRDRVVPTLEKLAASHRGETILVVAHNVVNRAALAHWLGLPIRYSRKLPQNNAAFNVLVFEESKTRVHTINVNKHLSGLIPAD